MKNLILYLIIFYTVNCPLTNKFVLKPSRVKGIEAKEILNNRLSSIFINDLSTGSYQSLGYALLFTVLAGIEDDKIYSRRDVESCATKIFLGAIAIDQPNITANRKLKTPGPSEPNSRLFPPLLCQLKPINKIIDLD